MSRFDLIGPSYTSESPSADAETLINWYPENLEQQGARTWATLYPRGGTYTGWTLPTNPIRGMIEINNHVFAAAGAAFYEIFDDGSYSLRGTIENDGNPVSLTASPQSVLVISGTKVYTTPVDGVGNSLDVVANLENSADTFTLEWTATQIAIATTTIPAAISAASESGTTVSLTVNISSLSALQQSFVIVGNAITVSSLGSGYDGDWVIAFVDKSIPSAAVVKYTAISTGLSPSSGGTFEIYVMQITGNIGVSVPSGSTVIITDCTHAAFNLTYTVIQSVGSSSAITLYCICPIALIGDGATGNDGNIVTPGFEPLQCDFCDGYFILFYRNSQYWRISNLFNAYAWDAIDTARIQVFPDNIVSMKVDHREVWFFAQTKSVAYNDTGNANFPFEVILGSFVESGANATFATSQLDNSIFWLDRDKRGHLVARRLNGYLPARVSNYAIEYIWQNYVTTSDVESFSYQWFGHTFWVLYFPTQNVTWVYDAALGMWHQEGYWTGTAYTALKARCHVAAFGMQLVGDWNSGNINILSATCNTDTGNTIRRERRAPPISNENQWFYHGQMQVDIEAGIGSLPDFTSITQFSALPLSYAATTGGTFPQGNYTFRIQKVAAGSVIGQSPDSSIVVLSTQIIGIDFTGLTAGTYNLYCTNDGWQTSYYLVYTLSGGGSTTLATFPSGWTAGLPPHTKSPVMNFRWSDDNTHTWSSTDAVNCPNSQQYASRGPILWRLGRSRKRTYEISCTDPVPWRIISGYLLATGYPVTERAAKQYAKVL